MSFLSDAVEGNWSHLGTDISHAGSSLMSHPSELYETLGGAAALATGGLALGALAPEAGVAGLAGGGADVGGLFSGMFGGAEGAPWLGTGAEAAAEGSDVAASTGFGTQGLSGAASGGAVGPDMASLAGGDPALGTGAGGAVYGPPMPAGPAAPPPSTGMLDTLTSPSQWTLGGVGKVGGALAAGAGLGMNLLRGNQMDPNQQKLQDLAGQLGSQGQVLESYLKTGKLPPALQAQLDQAKASEKARIIAGAAARGLPTDPRMNSALAQELNNVDTNAIAAMAKVQVDMLNTGLKETGMSMELYQMLTKLDMQQNEDLMKSIASFAAALGGGFGGAPAKAA
jgi:hypothetical protein